MLDGAYLVALALTLVLELPIVLGGFWRVRPRSRVVMVFAAANLFTHGTLWACWFHLPGDYLARLIVCESAVVIVEAAAYRVLLGVGAWRAAAVSLAANVASTVIGLALWI